MIANQRIIYDDNGTLNDISINLNNYRSASEVLPIVAAEDKIYIGSDLPFNHRYFEVSTVNDQASQLSVDIWGGSDWKAAVSVLDQTAVAGATLAQSGIISWTLDRNESWGLESTTEDIPDLSTLNIYHMYWARLNFSADLNANTALKYLGHKFADDDDLQTYYPQLNLSTVKTAFEAGKTDWDEQHIAAAEAIIRYLRKKQELWSASQILNWEQFNAAAVHRVATIIMNGFGDDYENDRTKAFNDFLQEINLGLFQIDRSEDGRDDQFERRPNVGLTRR